MFILIALSIVSFCNFALGIVVLVKNRKNPANVYFSLFATSLAIWIIVNHLSNNLAYGENVLLWLNRFTLFIPPFSLYFLLLFSMLFTNIAPKRFGLFAWIGGLISLSMACLGVSPGVMGELIPRNGIMTMVFGKLTPIYMTYVIGILITEVGTLWYSLGKLRGLARARTVYMSLSLFLALGIIIVTNLVIPFFTNDFSYLYIGLFSTVIIVGGFSYAIIKLRLFDIRLVIARSITYVLLTLTLGTVYAVVTFRIGGLIFDNSDIGVPQQTFGIITAVVLAFSFQPLRQFFEKFSDKIFYRHRYKSQDLINNVGKILASEIDLIPLSRRVRLLLAKNLHVQYVNIVVLNNGKVFTESGHYVVSKLENLALELNKMHNQILVTDELADGNKKDILESFEIGVYVPLKTREGRVGYMLFGHKLSGDIYTNGDLEVIRIIADQLAVAIQNAKSYVQVQQFNNTLQRKVNDATKRLREANDTLQQLDQVKDDFITMASHQLRTPLTISESYLASIKDEIFGKSNKEQKRALNVTQEYLHVTNGIISDLLNISRMEVGRFHIDLSLSDIKEIVKEQLDHLKLKADKYNVKIAYSETKLPIPQTYLDKQKTQQAILNLIDNAINYAPMGKVSVVLDYAGNNIIFTVTDNGIGVNDADKPKLFSKFFRADNAKNQRPDGTGIGLYLVKHVVEDQGGVIIFSSQVGDGSTFGFRLPIVTQNKKPQAQTPSKGN